MTSHYQPGTLSPRRQRPLPLYAQIKEALREGILDGTYRQHERIPSESDLMASYGVSRITVRQALGDLENEQLIFKIPGKGAFVSRPKPFQQLAKLQGFAEAVGARGMVWGQAQDIAAETALEPLDLVAIKRLQQAKTGALIQFSATVGAVLADQDPEALTEYARNLGLAFQIQDDVLDVTGDEAETGKRTNKDDAAGKATFVSLLGLEGAQDKARKLVRNAEAALETYGETAGNLRQLARFVIERDA